MKERYPTFVDALRDLNDALSLLFLFASLPSTVNVPPKTIALCQHLCLEFQHYLIVTHSLRKSFLSIKGIYYQATIQGQDILWLVPYKFVQRVTGDVDFRIMATFVEFYTTLLGFVNYRLYTSIGLVYPPKFDAKSDERGGELDALVLEAKNIDGTIEGELPAMDAHEAIEQASIAVDDALQKKVDQAVIGEASAEEEAPAAEQEPDGNSDTIDKFESVGAGGDLLVQSDISNAEASTLFASFTFFLSREAPRQPLEFLLRAFGCKRVGWGEVLGDGAYTSNERDSSITHQIVDRPPLPISDGISELPAPSELRESQSVPPGYRMPGRIYVQPQWVWDCINAGRLLRTDLYAPGATLPPHMSPWAKPRQGAYDPTVSLADQEREGEAEQFAEEEAQAAALEARETAESNRETGPFADGRETLADDGAESDISPAENGMRVAESDDSEEPETRAQPITTLDEGSKHQHDAERDVEEESDEHQAELEAEAAGMAYTSRHADGSIGTARATSNHSGSTDGVRKKVGQKRRQEDEELQRRMGMISGKKRKLFQKMMQGQKKGDADAEALRRKRRKLEAVKKGKPSSK